MRYGQAQSAYNAVRDRHEELQRVEASLAELATLMQDVSFHVSRFWIMLISLMQMSLMVEQQGDVIDNIEEKAREAHTDIERGYVFHRRKYERSLLYLRLQTRLYRKGEDQGDKLSQGPLDLLWYRPRYYRRSCDRSYHPSSVKCSDSHL